MPRKRNPPEKDAHRPDHQPWQHSTGPVTEEGKAISSQNARTHGCTSTQLLLPHEDPAEWEALKAAWLRDYSPECETFRELVLAAATAQWFLRRNDKRLNEAEQFLHTEAQASPLFWLEPQHRLYERILRYRTAAERGFLRARAAVEQYRRSRFYEAVHLRRDADRQAEAETRRTTGPEEHGPDSESEDERASLDALHSLAGPAPQSIEEIPAIVQHFRVSLTEGVLATFRSPSNSEILHLAERKTPPVLVRRTFRFEDFSAGVVPAEYSWILRTPENRGRQDSGYFLEFSRPEFQGLAAVEDPDPHALPLDPASFVNARNGESLFDLIMNSQLEPLLRPDENTPIR